MKDYRQDHVKILQSMQKSLSFEDISIHGLNQIHLRGICSLLSLLVEMECDKREENTQRPKAQKATRH